MYTETILIFTCELHTIQKKKNLMKDLQKLVNDTLR